jgi:hypothetical protein
VAKLKLNLVGFWQVDRISKLNAFNEYCVILIYKWNDLWGLCLALFCSILLRVWNLLDVENWDSI